MTKEEIFAKLKESIHDNTKTEAAMESDYDSMDIDSLDCILIIMDMEEACNVDIFDEEAEACKTVSSFVDMIYNKLADPA